MIFFPYLSALLLYVFVLGGFGVSLFSPGSQYAGQADLEIIEILLYLLPSPEIKGVHHHAWPLCLVLLSRFCSKQPYLTQAMHEASGFFPVVL